MDVFILTHLGIDYFNQWFDPAKFDETTKFHIMDNGQQTIPERLQPLVIHQTKVNTGCAGGWNLCYRIGFEYLKLEKMVMGQDDAIVTQEQLNQMWKHINPSLVVGLYDSHVKWSVVGMHRDTYSSVGEFDENCVFVYCEDADYDIRLRLDKRGTVRLGHDSRLNASITRQLTPDSANASKINNAQYMLSKWGIDHDYENPPSHAFTTPFNNPTMSFRDRAPIRPRVKEVYGDITEFPSQTEFKRFLEGR